MVISFNGKDKMVTMVDGKIDEYEWTGEVEMTHLEAKVELTGEYLGGEYFNFSFYEGFVNSAMMATCFSYAKDFEDKDCPDPVDVV